MHFTDSSGGVGVANAACPLRTAVRRCLSELPPHATGVVAVSGGPDSVALLRALLQETAAPLVVAHLNHQLRGADSDADEAFVRGLAPGFACRDSVSSMLNCYPQ